MVLADEVESELDLEADFSAPASSSGGGAAAAPSSPKYSASAGSLHPRVVFFHLLFKAGAIALYLLGALLFKSFVHAFVFCGICLTADFWVVQNVSGRLLVGLRWYNEIDDEGNSVWRYDSLDETALKQINAYDSTVFWWTLYLYPLCWIVLAMIALFSLKLTWLIICVLAIMLAGSNLVGYTRCSRDAKARINQLARDTVVSGLSAALRS